MNILMVVMTSSANGMSCPEMAVGVHEVMAGSAKTIIAVGKATALSEDEGSFDLAESEARLEARRSLINHLSPELKQMRLSGLVDVSVCRSGEEVFATVRLEEANIRRAANMQQLMQGSFQNNPTPR
jgi:hypothetical protein